MSRANGSAGTAANSVWTCWISLIKNGMRRSLIFPFIRSKTLSARLLRTRFEWFSRAIEGLAEAFRTVFVMR
jgi:hypothetical protein